MNKQNIIDRLLLPKEYLSERLTSFKEIRIKELIKMYVRMSKRNDNDITKRSMKLLEKVWNSNSIMNMIKIGSKFFDKEEIIFEMTKTLNEKTIDKVDIMLLEYHLKMI